MNKNLKIAIIGLVVLAGGFGLYLYFKNKGTSSNDPQKDQRRVTIKRN